MPMICLFRFTFLIFSFLRWIRFKRLLSPEYLRICFATFSRMANSMVTISREFPFLAPNQGYCTSFSYIASSQQPTSSKPASQRPAAIPRLLLMNLGKVENLSKSSAVSAVSVWFHSVREKIGIEISKDISFLIFYVSQLGFNVFCPRLSQFMNCFSLKYVRISSRT